MSKTQSFSFLTQYAPKTSKDIIGNRDKIKYLKDWIKGFKEKPKDTNASVIITGGPGTGKTTTAYKILEEQGYRVESLDFERLIEYVTNHSKVINSDIETYIKGFNKRRDLSDTLFGSSGSIAYVVDNIRMISAQKEKKILLALKKYNEIYKRFPLVLISDNQHNKLINELKKTVMEYNLANPTRSDLVPLIKKICKEENIKLDIPKISGESDDEKKDIVDVIVEHSQYDVRRLVNILQSLHDVFQDEVINQEKLDSFLISSKKKDTDVNLYLTTDNLFERYNGIDNSLIYFEKDKGLIPLTIHQNYPNYIHSKLTKYPTEKVIEMLYNIAENFSVGDVTEGYIYSNQTWDLHEIYGYYTTVVPSALINMTEIDGVKFEKNNHKMDGLQPCYKYDFPKDLNKTSIKNINKKNINNISPYFPGKSIKDYIYLNKIVNHYITTEQYSTIADLLNKYKVGIGQIDSLLKIDKIKNSKSTIRNEVKKKLSESLKN